MAVWVIKGGPLGERDARFLDHSIIGIPWPEVGDLSAFPDRDALKATYRALHPNRSDGHVNTQAGQLWRFARQMQVGDLVVVPLRFIREIAVGEITGEYRWTTDLRPGHAPRPGRRVVHDRCAPRRLPLDLLFSFGGSMSVCSVTRNNAEFRVRALMTGEPARPSG